jgi:DNA-binding cell septation regulator SpoVG
MSMSLRVTNVRYVVAPEDDATGLLGHISFTLNGALQIDGLTMRQTNDGRLTISFPSRTDRLGQRHFILRPLNDEHRRDIERQIMDAICSEDAL